MKGEPIKHSSMTIVPPSSSYSMDPCVDQSRRSVLMLPLYWMEAELYSDASWNGGDGDDNNNQQPQVIFEWNVRTGKGIDVDGKPPASNMPLPLPLHTHDDSKSISSQTMTSPTQPNPTSFPHLILYTKRREERGDTIQWDTLSV